MKMANSNISKRMSEMNVLEHKQAAVDCDFCEGTNNVHWRCQKCSANICRKCKFIHQSRSAFRNHNVVSRNKISALRLRSRVNLEIHPIKYLGTHMMHASRSSVWIEHESSITQVDNTGNIIKTLKFDFRPHGFTLTTSGSLFVCDRLENKVWIAHENKPHEVIINTPEEPYGLCVNSKQELVICMRNSVAVYKIDDKRMVKHVKSHPGKCDMEWPYKIKQNGNLDYILLNWEHHELICYDGSFAPKWKYISKQERSISAIDIACDKYDNIVIGYYSEVVEILSPDGVLLNVSDVGGVGVMKLISVADDDTLWVCDLSGSMAFFTFT